MNEHDSDDVDIDAHLHLETGIADDERSMVVESLEPLCGLLKSFDRGSLRIEAWVKNRSERGQLTYMSIHAKDTDVVAHDDSADLTDALVGVRKDLKRQLRDLSDRRTDRRR